MKKSPFNPADFLGAKVVTPLEQEKLRGGQTLGSQQQQQQIVLPPTQQQQQQIVIGSPQPPQTPTPPTRGFGL